MLLTVVALAAGNTVVENVAFPLERVTAGKNPAAEAGPTIVMTLPETVAL
jgi:hypothetical protein